jgi:hypothetical protein
MNSEQVFERVVTEVFSPLYELVAACAFVYFLYGVFMFLVNFNDPEKKNTGKKHLIWGIVGLFIIFSIGGILKLLNSLVNGMFVF